MNWFHKNEVGGCLLLIWRIESCRLLVIGEPDELLRGVSEAGVGIICYCVYVLFQHDVNLLGHLVGVVVFRSEEQGSRSRDLLLHQLAHLQVDLSLDFGGHGSKQLVGIDLRRGRPADRDPNCEHDRRGSRKFKDGENQVG